MTVPDPSRRRFLSYLAALGGLGVLGGIAWSERITATDALQVAQTTAPTTSTSTATSTSTTTTSDAPTTTTSTTSTTTSTTTTTEPPQRVISAICPEGWGALPVNGEFRTHTIERMTVHHTAVLLDDNTKSPARARQHQQYHQDRGWPDLAYHFLVDANGNVYQGRPVEAVGDTGTEYDPTNHFLVCCEGHFDEQEITELQLEALIDMLAWGAEEFGVSPDTIRGHRDWAETTCPGDDLYEYVASGYIEAAVEAKIAEGGVRLAVICGDEALARVADIEASVA